MATIPTNLPVPSESARDLKFNAGKIDEFVTSLNLKYSDRFGGEHYTIEGLRQLAQQAISAFGWVPMDSFQDGAHLHFPIRFCAGNFLMEMVIIIDGMAHFLKLFLWNQPLNLQAASVQENG